MASRLLILDFDGTVCLGDGPVLSYARHLDEALALSDPAHAGTIVFDTVARFLEGPTSVERADDVPADLAAELERVVGSADGYAAAAALARSRGILSDDLAGAYEASRAELADGGLRTWAPTGLRALLDGLPDEVGVVLVTNASVTGLGSQLARLGLDGSFDEIVTDAHKPSGMAAVLERLRTEHSLADHPERLFSVGDIWRNDLEPAAAQGSVTALIERFPDADARPTYRAGTFEELYPLVDEWARQA
ncbi:MAG: hypothetical protein JWP75_2271 [Frondihabitans sp.]|nr:hypothetical protein [Frondihabitans sp.]